MEEKLASLAAAVRQTRVEFLQAELKLAMTLVRLATTEAGLHESAAAADALRKARTAYDTVVRLLPLVEEPERHELEEWLRGLGRRLGV